METGSKDRPLTPIGLMEHQKEKALELITQLNPGQLANIQELLDEASQNERQVDGSFPSFRYAMMAGIHYQRAYRTAQQNLYPVSPA